MRQSEKERKRDRKGWREGGGEREQTEMSWALESSKARPSDMPPPIKLKFLMFPTPFLLLTKHSNIFIHIQ